MNIKHKCFDIDCVMFLWLVSVLIIMMLILNPNINKANAIFFPLVYFVYIGIVEIVNRKRVLIFPIFIMYVFNFSLFSNYYFTQYNKDYNRQKFFATSYLEALSYSKTLNYNKIYIDNQVTEQPLIYVLLDNFVSPYDYSNENIVETFYDGRKIVYKYYDMETIDINAVYITKANSNLSKSLEKLNWFVEEFDNILVFHG